VKPTTPSAAGGRATLGRAAIAVAAAAAVGVLAGLTAHLLLAPKASRPVGLPLPYLHGQATWAAGQRPAPPFTLDAVVGRSTSLVSMRGHAVLIAFLDSRCRSLCPIIGRAIGDAQRALPAAAQPAVLIVSVDPAGDSPASVRSAAHRWRMAPGWHWLSGTRQQLAAVWRTYGIEVQPTTNDIVHGAAVYLVDPRGYERAGYLAPLLPNLLALDIRRVEAQTA
jgi:protein SCO1/2